MSFIASSILIFIPLVLLSACGGDSDVSSGAGGSVTTSEERDARSCITLGDLTSPNTIRIANSCDHPVVIRILTGGTGSPATIPANSSIDYLVTITNPAGAVGFGACTAPFTPVQQGATGFDCQ